MERFMYEEKKRREIIEVIKGNLTPRKMSKRLLEYHQNDIAQVLPELSEEETEKLFHALPEREAAEILEYAQNPEKYFKLLTAEKRAALLSHMESSFAAELLTELSGEERRLLLRLASPEATDKISLIKSFDEDEIGSRMSTNYIKIREGITVKTAMSELIRQAADNDNVSVIYLVDAAGCFAGTIALKDLIVAREDTPLCEITSYSYPYLYAHSKITDCISFFIDYSEESVPVLDEENCLVGVVTAQDFVDILEDELNEDYAKLAGLSAAEDVYETVPKSVKKRFPWLMILLALGLLVSLVVGAFEGVVAQLPVIICFQSLILDMAGNVGTQSLAVAIRVLTDGKISKNDKLKLVKKELFVGILNGLLLGILSVVIIGAYLSLKGYGIGFSFAVSSCLGCAMLFAMAISALSGTVIPMLFKRIGIDPAVASGPLITTLNDLAAVVTYYGLAWLILIRVMGI